MLIPFLIFFLILSSLVIIHELGHFIAAKKNGVTVHEFGFGLPPKIWGKKKGETEYTLNVLPIGGFVRIEGEDAFESNKSDKKSFLNKSPKVKLLILMAGVLMNIALAIVLYYFYFIFNNFISNPLIKFTDFNFLMAKELTLETAISGISNTDVKDKLREGDIVFNIKEWGTGGIEMFVGVAGPRKLNELTKEDLEDKNKNEVIKLISSNISAKQMQEFVNTSNNDLELSLYNIQERKFRDVTVTPKFNEELNRKVLGVYLGSIFYLDYSSNLVTMVLSSPVHSVNVVGYSTVSFAKLMGASFQKGDIQSLSSGVSGPIGIFTIVKSVLESKSPDIFWLIIDLSALISLSLAFMNALPIPALDGGRAVFVVYRMLTKRTVNPKYEAYVHRAGMIFLLFLIAVITLKDFINLF